MIKDPTNKNVSIIQSDSIKIKPDRFFQTGRVGQCLNFSADENFSLLEFDYGVTKAFQPPLKFRLMKGKGYRVDSSFSVGLKGKIIFL
jgi:hypothetical protein